MAINTVVLIVLTLFRTLTFYCDLEIICPDVIRGQVLILF